MYCLTGGGRNLSTQIEAFRRSVIQAARPSAHTHSLPLRLGEVVRSSPRACPGPAFVDPSFQKRRHYGFHTHYGKPATDQDDLHRVGYLERPTDRPTAAYLARYAGVPPAAFPLSIIPLPPRPIFRAIGMLPNCSSPAPVASGLCAVHGVSAGISVGPG